MFYDRLVDPGVLELARRDAEALSAAGLTYEIVPRVTAASGAAAAMGGFLTERGKTDTLVLTTGRKVDAHIPPDWVRHLSTRSHVAVYMGVQTAGQIVDVLSNAGLLDRVHVTAVANAQRVDQQVLDCPARDLVARIAVEKLTSPAILFLRQIDTTSASTALRAG